MPETVATTRWRAEEVAQIDIGPIPEIPIVTAADAVRILPDFDLWDMWPVCLPDGRTAEFDGTILWIALSAPIGDHPDLRHDIARLRLLASCKGHWRDLGNMLPDGHSLGTREWAGSATYDLTTEILTCFYTATGRRGEPTSFEQRMFETRASLAVVAGQIELGRWTDPTELFASDGDLYVDTRTTAGGAGLIKGFRDPGYIRDPRDDREYIVFTGSDGRSTNSHNGVIGIAELRCEGWKLRPPIISGDGLNNEFERPHVLVRDGFYYIFWSTQRHVFAPGGPSAPNGLYAMVAERIEGPYRPLNGTGLVAANPASEPTQTYSWLVLSTLDVISFIDLWDMRGRTRHNRPELAVSNFGGTSAPPFRIALDGDRSTLVVGPHS